MKEYRKPAMMALSISANDMLCSGCPEGNRLKDPVFQDMLKPFYQDANNDGKIDQGEVGNDFVQDACTQTREEFEIYCKHTPESVVLWS